MQPGRLTVAKDAHATAGTPGLLAGPLLGAAAGEMAHGRQWRDASRIGVGTWIGLLVGAIFKVLLALAMLLVFVGALVLN